VFVGDSGGGLVLIEWVEYPVKKVEVSASVQRQGYQLVCLSVLVEDIVDVVGGVLLVLDFFGIVGVLELLHFDTYLQRELVTENLSRRWRWSEILIRHLIIIHFEGSEEDWLVRSVGQVFELRGRGPWEVGGRSD
jgi:hypothetical protein